MKNSDLDTAGALIVIFGYIITLSVLAVGWVFNLMNIWHSIDAPMTAKFILRCIGVFVFPVGGILGYI